MHSRIFVISEKKDAYDVLLDEEDMRVAIRADYVVPSEDLGNDTEWLVDWLNDLLGQKVVKMDKVKLNIEGEEREGFCIYPTNAIISALRQEREGKVKKIKELLTKEPPDLLGIHLEAWNDDGFYFVIDPYHMEPTMGLLELLERKQKSGTLPDRLYVVGSYDYHI